MTPMLRQYLEIKEQHPDALLLFNPVLKVLPRHIPGMVLMAPMDEIMFPP